MSRGVGVIMSKYEWGNVESVVAYHERERLCPEGVCGCRGVCEKVWRVCGPTMGGGGYARRV